MKKYKIATIPRDDIETEVMDATLKVLTALGSKIHTHAWKKTVQLNLLKQLPLNSKCFLGNT